MTHRFIEERKKNVCRTPKCKQWQITTLHVRSVKSSHLFQKCSFEEFAIHIFLLSFAFAVIVWHSLSSRKDTEKLISHFQNCSEAENYGVIKFISYSAVYIYDFRIFKFIASLLYGFVTSQHNDQLPELACQLTGMADVTGSKPVRFKTHFLSRSSHIWCSYSQSYSFSIKRAGLMTYNEKTGFCKESLDCFLI